MSTFSDASAAWVRAHLPARPDDANKGTHGRVIVIGGSASYMGAPALAALAAYRSGAGLVSLCVPPEVVTVAAGLLPEATLLPFHPDAMRGERGVSAVVIGPGLGQTEPARAFHREYFRAPLDVPHVIDADALNMFAPISAFSSVKLPPRSVLTPHPGEMARLIAGTVAQVQASRSDIASTSARAWASTVILKGARTVVAGVGGEGVLIPFSNPALAVAGTGDVLAGVVGGLLAQGLDPFAAAVCGAYLHALAGGRWREMHGDAGLLARELAALLPDMLKQLRDPTSR